MRLRLVPALVVSASLATVVSIAAVYTPKSGETQQQAAVPAPTLPTPAKGAPAAIVNGVTITTEDVDSGIAQTLSKLQEQIYSTRLTRLDAMIEDRLIAQEAKKRGVSTSAFIDAEITAKIGQVTDAEIAAFYEQNKTKLQGDLPKWQDQIRTYMNGLRVASARAELVKRLRDAAAVKVLLEAPPVYRASVVLTGAQVRGNTAAPVTIVEFSDFHCPFCRQVQPVLVQLLQKYGDRVRLVYKDLPLDSLHAQARGVAEAARCAAEQGKFWEFHDKVYAGSPDGSAATLQRYAQEAGVADVPRFEACRTSRKYQTEVQKDVTEGTMLGISGTPGFFINGRFLSGAQPLEAFTRIIDQELAAAPGATSSAR